MLKFEYINGSQIMLILLFPSALHIYIEIGRDLHNHTDRKLGLKFLQLNLKFNKIILNIYLKISISSAQGIDYYKEYTVHTHIHT